MKTLPELRKIIVITWRILWKFQRPHLSQIFTVGKSGFFSASAGVWLCRAVVFACKIDLKVAMTNVFFPTDSSFDILEFLMKHIFTGLRKPRRGLMDKSLYMDRNSCKWSSEKEERDIWHFSATWKCIILCLQGPHFYLFFSLWENGFVWAAPSIAVNSWSLLGFSLTVWHLRGKGEQHVWC